MFALLQQHADPKQLQQQHRLQHTAAEPQQQHAHHRPLAQSLADTLAAAAGGKAGSSKSVLAQHGVDEGYTPPMPPDLVLFPQNTQQARVWWLGVAPLSRSLADTAPVFLRGCAGVGCAGAVQPAPPASHPFRGRNLN